jgi:transcriptional regulator with XRE-family HTH domain
MPPRRGAPTLGARARQQRISKGLTQLDAGELIGKSQAYVSQLEKDLRSREELHEYRHALSNAPSQQRTAGGRHKAGRAPRSVDGFVDPATFRGEPLKPGFDYAATFRGDAGWEIIGICRTAADTELAFLFNKEHDIFGIVGFHRVGGELKRGRIIAITTDYDDAVSEALEAFANGNIDMDEDDDDATDDHVLSDDGLLADDGD